MKKHQLVIVALLSVSAIAAMLAISLQQPPGALAVAQLEIESAIDREYDMPEEAEPSRDAEPRRELHVRPDGTPAGDGSLERPWDLASALAGKLLEPGDVLWVHEGDYKGEFVSELQGAKGAPVIVRGFPGERARLIGCNGGTTLSIRGDYTWFWGLEVTSCEADRYRPDSDQQPQNFDIGVQILGHDTRLVNNLIHDTSQGISAYAGPKRVEMYGNVVTFNGYDLKDRGHGHGIYAQNEFGTLRINDNIIAHQFGHGLHAYSEKTFLNGISLQGNIIFSNGSVSRASRGRTRNILIGGMVVADSPTMISNYTYYPVDGGDGENNLGYSAGCIHPRLYFNYFAGPSPLRMRKCENVEFKDNTFIGEIQEFYITDYPGNTLERQTPTRSAAFVRANTWESKRGHVAIYNWGLEPDITVNISALGFSVDDKLLLHNVQDYFNDVQEYIVTGPDLTISMQRPPSVEVAGNRQSVQTFPQFGAFVIEAAYSK